MIMTVPDTQAKDLLTVLTCQDGRNDATSARNAATVLREACGESDLTRLLDRLAEKVDWLEAALA